MSNIIVIMSDEHNPFYSSVYGHPFIKTPHMERLAEQGTVFTNAYCPSPLCLPSRSAFLAGKRVHELQTYSNCNLNLNPDLPSFGKMLAEQGVYTVYIGKTDVYAQGEKLGFSSMLAPKDRKQPGDVNFARKPFTVRKGASERASFYGPKENAGYVQDEKMIDIAVTWLDSTAKSLLQPWVMTVNVVNPHFPHYCKQEYWDLYPEGGDLPRYGAECESANHPYALDLRKHFETDLFREEDVKGLRRGYLACISFVDDQIGRIVDAVERNGLSETTNIIYVSDHGDMLGKFGMWWKCSLYEDSVRIPCIAAGPDFRKGTRIETPVDLHDVQAAMFQAAGVVQPEAWVGTPLQEMEENDRNRVVFAEYHGHGTRSGAYMVRKGEWKLIYYMEAPHQLFNLREDPFELRNVYPEFAEKAMELESELRQICNPERENEKAHQFQEMQRKLLPTEL